jgi:hypothetical protein
MMEVKSIDFPESELGQNCQDFMAELRQECTESTVRTYGLALKRFLEWQEKSE